MIFGVERDNPKQMQCIKVLGLHRQYSLIDRLGLNQLTLLVQANCLLKQLG